MDEALKESFFISSPFFAPTKERQNAICIIPLYITVNVNRGIKGTTVPSIQLRCSICGVQYAFSSP
jgi:hypothetical protein